MLGELALEPACLLTGLLIAFAEDHNLWWYMNFSNGEFGYKWQL
jgi:hypothetical protein